MNPRSFFLAASLVTGLLAASQPSLGQSLKSDGKFTILHVAWLTTEHFGPIHYSGCWVDEDPGNLSIPYYAGALIVPRSGTVRFKSAGPLFKTYLEDFAGAWNATSGPVARRTGREPTSLGDAFAANGCLGCAALKRRAARKKKEFLYRDDPEFLPAIVDNLLLLGFSIVRMETNATGVVDWRPVFGVVQPYKCRMVRPEKYRRP